ncbi:Transcription elongation factor A protein 1 [Lamellibrachia satsuma]|nr:Transcription elongation factor A protein 1 [Lamellibrachia satsuma]
MGCEEDVAKIGKKLEKMVASGTTDHAGALDMLNTLKKLPMKLEVLQKTRIGMTVNNFRKACSNDEVVSLAKSLIKSWKKLLPESNNSSGPLSRSNSTTSMSSTTSSHNCDNSQETPPTPGESSDNTPSGDDRSQKTFPAKAAVTTDGIRLKCRELMTSALKMDSPPENSGDVEDLGAAIEECIFQEFSNTGPKYKNRVRSRVSNLKDSRNPQLRNNVLLGYISPDKIAVMTAVEMASDEMKAMRQKFTKEAIDDHQMAKTGGTTSSLLKCGKCLKRNCTYNQVQTRSADEPMTTFVFCNECGNRWKFC